MNTQSLYKKLTKRERISLYLQAMDRGDSQEADAVRLASPHRTVTQPDFTDELIVLSDVMFIHLLHQMDRLLVLFLMLGQVGRMPEAKEIAQKITSSYLTNEEAWQHVCEEYGFGYQKKHAQIRSEMLSGRLQSREQIKEIDTTFRLLNQNQNEAAEAPPVEEMKTEYETLIQELLSHYR